MNKQYRYLTSNRLKYKKYNVITNDTVKLITALFVNSTDNSSSNIAKLTNIPESMVNEILSDLLNRRDELVTVVQDADRFHEVTETSIRDISPIEDIVAHFNTSTISAPDFSTRLQTIKTLR